MNRRAFLATGLAAGGAAILPGRLRAGSVSPGETTPPPAEPAAVYEAGDRTQLFVDQHLVRHASRVSFSLHPARKHPLNPLVRAEHPWEGNWIRLYGSVLYDEEERLFKMWYVGEANRWFPQRAVFYATSSDGLKWEKPLVGTVKHPELPKHNAVLEFVEVANVVKDPDDPDPARRYKMIACDNRKIPPSVHPNNPHVWISPDGLNWTRLTTQPLFYSSDVMTALHDRRNRRYLAMPKVVMPVRGLKRRCFGLSSSTDLLSWTEPRMLFQPDRRDDAGTLARLAEARPVLAFPDDPAVMRTDFYGMGTYQAESCLIMFPWVFSVNGHSPVTGKHGGPGEVQFGVLRHDDHWDRMFRDAVIPLGQAGSWDGGFVTTAAEAFRHGDEIRLYYGAGRSTHANPDANNGKSFTRAIGLATWPLNRFVSAEGGAEGGILTTVPVRFSGRRLELNLGSARGRLEVGLLDAAGNPLAGFEASDPLSLDALRATVTWKGNADVSRLAGQAVSLRFNLRDAALYSFGFHE